MQRLPEQPSQTVILLKAADVGYKAGCHQDDTITIVPNTHSHTGVVFALSNIHCGRQIHSERLRDIQQGSSCDRIHAMHTAERYEAEKTR